ncbi:MAG TPA: 2-polyprenyl-3-methyl-6-methoxy-1,4-benzoquinone monooxygenase [Gammaproteobacteria bacterium]
MPPKTPDRRPLSPLDRILAELDQALRTGGIQNPVADKPFPAHQAGVETTLSEAERALSEGLMRVNHTGEIAAQALYRGQALVARDPQQRQHLLTAAAEEQDHLAWCQRRLQELNGHSSRLAPFWYAGSFLIGALAGLAGDRWSMGFVEETEKQVSDHLDDHLGQLPPADHASRVVLEQMRSDESRHADAARAAGAQELPVPVKQLMARTADLMRFISFRI